MGGATLVNPEELDYYGLNFDPPCHWFNFKFCAVAITSAQTFLSHCNYYYTSSEPAKEQLEASNKIWTCHQGKSTASYRLRSRWQEHAERCSDCTPEPCRLSRPAWWEEYWHSRRVLIYRTGRTADDRFALRQPGESLERRW